MFPTFIDARLCGNHRELVMRVRRKHLIRASCILRSRLSVMRMLHRIFFDLAFLSCQFLAIQFDQLSWNSGNRLWKCWNHFGPYYEQASVLAVELKIFKISFLMFRSNYFWEKKKHFCPSSECFTILHASVKNSQNSNTAVSCKLHVNGVRSLFRSFL